MVEQLTKAALKKKAIGIGKVTLASRFLGALREFLMARYLGTGAVADAFVIAFKVPNFLRKIFAEGALSSAFIPTFISTMRNHGKHEANALMSLSFILFEGIVLCLSILMMWQSPLVIYLIAPGFSPDQIKLAASFLVILIPFILFLSSNALFAGALQAAGNFFVPAFAPVLLNIVMIIGLVVSWIYNLPVTYFCFFILCGGFIQFASHLITYFKLNFSFEKTTPQSWDSLTEIVYNFIPALLSMSIMELSLFISTGFASYLPQGSVSLLYYANRFMGIPLGVFATSFSTILLPHFSRINTYAPKRLSFYLLESAKLVFWITVPTMVLMIFFSEKIFSTFFLSKQFSYSDVLQAQSILIAFVSGLFFFSLNKILLNIYYVLNKRVYTLGIALAVMLINVVLNFVLMRWLQVTGLAISLTLASMVQTMLSLGFLSFYGGFRLYVRPFIRFAVRYVGQLLVILGFFLSCYHLFIKAIMLLPAGVQPFFLYTFGYWAWAGPLALWVFMLLYISRQWFGIKLYFLD